MYLPALSIDKLLNQIMRVHCQHKLTFERTQHLEQSAKIIFSEHTRVVAHVASNVRWIDKMKGALGIEASQNS